MNNTIVISPKENLIDVIANLMSVNECDLSNQIAVFPGKRPAHFLRKRLSEKIGHSYIPPKIYSIDNFIDFLAKEKLGIKSRIVSDLDAVGILYDIHNQMKEKIGGEQFAMLDNFIPLALMIFGELEELLLADVEIKTIKSLVKGLPYGKINILADYYEKFYEEIKSRNLLTRALQYSEVARQISSIDFSNYPQIIFCGFYALTSVEKKILSELRNRPNVFFVFQRVEGHVSNLYNNNDSKIIEDNSQTEGTDITIIKSPDSHGQVFALNALLQSQINKSNGINESYTIVLPRADTLFPLYNEILASIPESNYNIALGYPLSRTPIFRFISSLSTLAASKVNGKYLSTIYLKFLLHPYTKNIRYNGKSEITRVLVHTIEKYFADNPSKKLFTLDEIENWVDLFDQAARVVSAEGETIGRKEIQEHLFSIHSNTVRLLEDIKTIGEYAVKCKTALMYIYDNSTANLHPLFYQYAERIIDVLEQIETSLINRACFKSAESYIQLLNYYVGNQSIPFTGTPLKGLQVLGLLETRSLKFDTVFILDVNEAVLPPLQTNDMLLPQKLRQTLGMETYRNREKLIEYYFNLLVQGAKKVYLFFSETSTGDKERSRYIQKLIWQKEKKQKNILSDDLISSVRYNVRLTNKIPMPISKSKEIVAYLNTIEFNATMLDTYLKCQLKFYYLYVLRLNEKETVSEEPNQAEIGKMVHTILAKMFLPLVGNNLTAEDIKKIPTEEIINQEFQKKYGADIAGAHALIYNQIRKRIESFILYYQLPVIEEGEINLIDLEKNLQVVDNNVILKARCDRIEKRNGKIFIIDYKTAGRDANYKINWKNLSFEERNAWCDNIGSLQLPFYWLVYSLSQSESVENIVPVYLLLGKNRISSEIEIRLLMEGEKDRYSLMRDIIHTLIREIRNAELSFIPAKNLTETCKHCCFTTICGTDWIK